MQITTYKRMILSLMALFTFFICGTASAEPFIGEIRWIAFDYVPYGWAACDGSIINIQQNSALYALLGNRYGGDGRTTFGLPDLRGRAPIHVSSTHALASAGGEEKHILTINEMQSHIHTMTGDPAEGNSNDPTGQYLAKSSNGVSAYGTTVNTALHYASLSVTGNGTGHENMKPFVAMRCIIATIGVFPSRP